MLEGFVIFTKVDYKTKSWYCFFTRNLQLLWNWKSVEIWWKGKMLFKYGTNHSKGVLILFSDDLQIDIKNMQVDNNGQQIFVNVFVQDAPFLFVNYTHNLKHANKSYSSINLGTS